MQATLVDVLIDGFEKNEILHGFHDRLLPMSSEGEAQAKFATLAREAGSWMGTPASTFDSGTRRLAVWSDLELRQAGRGILIRVRAPWFMDWWHDEATWAGEPLADVYGWLAEEARVDEGGNDEP